MAAYISNSVFNDVFCFYCIATFLVGTHLGVPFPKLKTFSEIFWVLHIDHSQYKKTIL